MSLPAWTGICILAAISAFPGGESVPSPPPGQRYTYDVALDLEKYLAGEHQRERRRAGRGYANSTWACNTITTVPNEVRTDFPLCSFYQKYTHAYGIPILASNHARDAALTRACYVVRFLLADRKDIRDAMYDQYGRVAVIAQTEQTTDIPEHSFLDSAWNYRARGLGGTRGRPVTTDGEENLVCKPYPDDRWHEEDVLVHEFAHAIHLISLRSLDSSFQSTLKDIYKMAKAENLWSWTYAIRTYKEYFAEGVQGFFSVQTCRPMGFVDGVHNHICTRDNLRGYDQRLYDLIAWVFPCGNTIVSRCEPNQDLAAYQILQMNCNTDDTIAKMGPKP